MEHEKKRLTLVEAAALVAGIGVGGGIMATPYLAARCGLAQFIAIMIAAYALSLILHLMIAETVLRDGQGLQFVELFDRYVFRGRIGAALTWIFFVLLLIGFVCNLAGYIAGGAEIFKALFGLPMWAGNSLTYIAAAGVVFFGLKAIGVSEKFAIIGIAILLVVLSAGAVGHPIRPIPLLRGGGRAALALYGMVMFGFACFFSIPQAVEGLWWNPKLVPRAVALGIAINFVFVLVITLMSLLLSKSVTQVAMVGWGEAIGPWALTLGSLFALLAILTSYWAVSYTMAVILCERLGWSYRPAWLCATLPSFILAVTGLTGFLGFMRVTGGAIAVMLGLLVVPALRATRREHPGAAPAFNLAGFGGPLFQVIVIIAYILMAVGSAVPVK